MSYRTPNRYAKGSTPRLLAVFRSIDGALVDPQTVKVYVKDPAGVTAIKQFGQDAEVIKESAGRYYIDVDADTEGRWSYRWESTGDGKGADERDFVIEPSNFV